MKRVKLVAAIVAVAFVIGSAFTVAPQQFGFDSRAEFDANHWAYQVIDLTQVTGEECITGSKACQVSIDPSLVVELTDPDGTSEPLRIFKLAKTGAPSITGAQQIAFDE